MVMRLVVTALQNLDLDREENDHQVIPGCPSRDKQHPGRQCCHKGGHTAESIFEALLQHRGKSTLAGPDDLIKSRT